MTNDNFPSNKVKSAISKHSVLIAYIGLFLIAIIFITAFSLWTSPLYRHWYGCDASFFTLVGRGIKEGLVPYADFYDLKGPYFFFLQAAGQLIFEGKTGIYILEILFFFWSLCIICKLSSLYISRKKTLIVILIFLYPYITMLWGGNCLEEFCLPLNLSVIYLTLKNFGHASFNKSLKSFNEKKINLTALLTGIFACIMIFSKITVLAPTLGIVLTVFLIFFKDKKYKHLAYYCLYLLLGFLIALIPLLIYFGLSGNILNMLYCVFVFGFKRSRGYSNGFNKNLEIRLLGCLFAFFFAFLHSTDFAPAYGTTASFSFKHPFKWLLSKSASLKNHPSPVTNKDKCLLEIKSKQTLSSFEWCFLILASIITYFALHLGDAFIYYFVTTVPVFILAVILFLRKYDPLIIFTGKSQMICLILFTIYAAHYVRESNGTIRTFVSRGSDTFQETYYKNTLDMCSLIPEFERDSVFSFEIDMQWYEINKILPCNKYVVNLPYFISLFPEIETELENTLKNTPPKWMVIGENTPNSMPNLFAIVNSDYTLIYENELGALYVHN